MATVAALGAVLVGFLAWRWWAQDTPRRHSIHALKSLHAALDSADGNALLNSVALPSALQGRTSAEQFEFLQKALRDEISDEGLAVLRRDGTFGALTNLFPAEAEQWARQAGVNPGDCVAFKLERHGLRAEVVLARPSTLNSLARRNEAETAQPSTSFRFVRCNNVKQLAMP